MNRTKQNILICLASILILPCLLCQWLFGKALPYLLTGKFFLIFFFLYMVVSYTALIMYSGQEMTPASTRKMTKLMIIITLVISISRAAQGIYHHKPIGFLVVLTILHLLALIAASTVLARLNDQANK